MLSGSLHIYIRLHFNRCKCVVLALHVDCSDLYSRVGQLKAREISLPQEGNRSSKSLLLFHERKFICRVADLHLENDILVTFVFEPNDAVDVMGGHNGIYS